MKILIKYLFLFIIFLTIGCSGKEDKDISVLLSTDLDQQMSEVYREGLEAYKQEDFLVATRKSSCLYASNPSLYTSLICWSRSVLNKTEISLSSLPEQPMVRNIINKNKYLINIFINYF